MDIEIAENGTVKWRFNRKSYKKARWRRLGTRLLTDFQKEKRANGLIFIMWNRCGIASISREAFEDQWIANFKITL